MFIMSTQTRVLYMHKTLQNIVYIDTISTVLYFKGFQAIWQFDLRFLSLTTGDVAVRDRVLHRHRHRMDNTNKCSCTCTVMFFFTYVIITMKHF